MITAVCSTDADNRAGQTPPRSEMIPKDLEAQVRLPPVPYTTFSSLASTHDSRLLERDDPPPYSPRPGNDHNSNNRPNGPPRCTCPRREGDGAHTGTNAQGGGGIDGAKVAKVVGGALLIGVAAPVLVTGVAAAALGAVGFTTGGVAAGTSLRVISSRIFYHRAVHLRATGSAAAWAQSVFWGASTGGVFSLLQSTSATIAAPAAMKVVGAAAVGIMVGKAIAEGTGAGNGGNGGGGGGDNGTEGEDRRGNGGTAP